MPRLYTYKASAGSGKTYRLTNNYLELLFKDPSAYRNILAVTFTNKAAGDMKGRILRELFLLSTGEDRSGAISDNLYKLSQSLKLPPVDVSKRATQILDSILNDYSRFSVGTIDRFFQVIIRAFTRETGMMASYNLEINEREILAEASDNLLYEMDDNEVLRSWLIQYAEEIIREGKALNMTREIINLGNEIFKETFRSLNKNHNAENINDAKIKEYSRVIKHIIYPFEIRMKELGQSFLETTGRYGLELTDFKNGSRSFTLFFKRIINPEKYDSFKYSTAVNKAIDNPLEWYAIKSDKKDQIIKAYDGGLNDILKNTIKFVDRYYEEYSTAAEIDKFIYAFGIIYDLSRNVRQILKERNLFLLSDSSQFLYEIIGKNDTPFIYEKAGVYYKNFMLDEFQDTSVYQWENFKPLINNSLSQGYDNLVVGDVKQSIYRWRNSDWNILDSGIKQTFPDYYEEIALRENWRSRGNIVLFNNFIFTESAEKVKYEFLNISEDENNYRDEMILLADKISSAYKDTLQIQPANGKREGGYVKLRFLLPGLKKDENINEISKQLPELICDLQNRSYKAGDIAVLVRDGKQGKQVASILLEYKNNFLPHDGKYNFNLISNDSLFISNNAAVQFLVALLRQIADSSNSINEAFLKHEYYRYILNGREMPADYHFIFDKTLLNYAGSFDKIFNDFITENKNILRLSLFELVEQLILIFHLNENSGDIPYFQAFQDTILNFMQKESSDISSFIKYWDETGNTETLNISEQQDAIRIMTIHKSKGLEFKIVVIPFCNWSLDHNPRLKINVLWCKTRTKPFDFLPFVPVNYSSKLKNTFFFPEYQVERLHAFVDNLNLLYVALTRAKEELHIYSSPSKSNDKKPKITHVGDVLLTALENPSKNKKLNYNKVNDGENLVYEFGQPGKPAPVSSELIKSEAFDYYPVNAISKNLRIRFHDSKYFSPDPDKPGSIDYGIIMHEILSRVRNRDDLSGSVEKAFREGKIDKLKKMEICKVFEEGFARSIPPEMFQPGWKVYTERDILTSEGEYRPDRIMFRGDSAIIIDFKFGMEIRSSGTSQVRNYMKWIREAGYFDVKAYIWYFSLGKTEEVKYEG